MVSYISFNMIINDLTMNKCFALTIDWLSYSDKISYHLLPFKIALFFIDFDHFGEAKYNGKSGIRLTSYE